MGCANYYADIFKEVSIVFLPDSYVDLLLLRLG